MSQRSKFEQSRQYDTEGTGVAPNDFTAEYNLFATTTWPDVTKPTLSTGKTRFHAAGVFHTSGPVDRTKTLNASSLDLQNLT